MPVRSMVEEQNEVLLTLNLLRSARASRRSSFECSLHMSMSNLIIAWQVTAGLLAAQWMAVSPSLFLMAKEECHAGNNIHVHVCL